MKNRFKKTSLTDAYFHACAHETFFDKNPRYGYTLEWNKATNRLLVATIDREDYILKNTTSRRRPAVKPVAPNAVDELLKASVPVSSPPVTPSPAGTIVVWKRYSETTGGPQVAVRFQMPDPAFNREYVFDVPTAEALANQILAVGQQHREEFDSDWFTEQPTVER